LWHSALGEAARSHAIDMAENDMMSHTGSDGSTMLVRIERAGLGGEWLMLAENVAAGQRTPEAVVAAWMDSPGHRANILEPGLTHLGVGVHRYPGTRFMYYWAQKFAAFR
jgi:uncharacterized protein YkwD